MPTQVGTRRKTWLVGGGLNPLLSVGFKPAVCLDIQWAWKSGLKPLLSMNFMPTKLTQAFVGGHGFGGLDGGLEIISSPRRLA
jgi:hypothetical protein